MLRFCTFPIEVVWDVVTPSSTCEHRLEEWVISGYLIPDCLSDGAIFVDFCEQFSSKWLAIDSSFLQLLSQSTLHAQELNSHSSESILHFSVDNVVRHL